MVSSGSGVVVFRRTGGPEDVDAIDEYSRRLVAALADTGTEARYEPGGLTPVLAIPRPPRWVLLQYNPYRYGRAGFAPGLLRAAAQLRRRWPVPLVVMIHETWLEMTSPRSTLIGLWQRVQLRALVRLADVVLTSTEAIAALFRGAVHVPIAANIVPARSGVSLAARSRPEGDRLVLTLFGGGHPSRALDHAEAAIAAVAEIRGADRVLVLNLGADAPPIRVPAGVEVRAPGKLPPAELSDQLTASDLVLLPFRDGVSTRRGTLMASLAHGLPVLGLTGTGTDSVLVKAPAALVLTPVGELETYARTAVELICDPQRRRAIGAAGRQLYASQFDWPVLAAKVAAVTGELGAPTRFDTSG